MPPVERREASAFAKRALRLTSAEFGAPRGAPLPSLCVRARKEKEARPARRYKRAAERWLFDT
jgi:hypothetical protein